ncbi:MAG TPA: phenylalanine 4-monooxygenase [Fontimonas sp.]
MDDAHTSKALRGDYSRARSDYSVEQSWHAYSEADHALWRRLYARQTEQVAAYACREFAEGLKLTDCAERIPDIDRISELLEARSGWRLIAVPGFIPNEQFFAHLAARRFPVTVWIRKPEEFDYLVEPDIFHDFFGHVPMFFDPTFAAFMQRFGELGLQALHDGALALVARLYWYTVEFGLIEQDGELRAFGAGILSSAGETRYSVGSPVPQRIRLDVARCMRTQYRIDDYQKTYFVIRSIDELVAAVTQDLGPMIATQRELPELLAERHYPGDHRVPPRTALRAA